MAANAGPEIVFVGDDFTGASDTLATLARAGLRARLYLDPPGRAEVGRERLDAVGVATELRALGPDAIADRIGTMAPAITALKPRFIHYKVCSTFDSSPSVGSIGAAVDALESHLCPTLVAIIGGQPSLRRYCLFGNLFAAASDGMIHRIDRHPAMRSHPTTPMHESDLRLHLAVQGLSRIDLVPWTQIGSEPTALADRIGERMARGERYILFDASESTHLETVGAALRSLQSSDRPIVIVGASSVAESLTWSRSRAAGPAPTVAERDALEAGPYLVVAGSRSAVTAAQVASAACYDKFAVSPEDLVEPMSDETLVMAVASSLRKGHNALAHLAPDRDYDVAGVELARRLAELTARILEKVPVRALGIAGGDTSSVIVRRLGFVSLAYHGDLDAGVTVCSGRSRDARRDGMRLMLKGGQMGCVGLLDRFALAIGGAEATATP